MKSTKSDLRFAMFGSAIVLCLSIPAVAQSSDPQQEHFVRTFALAPAGTLTVDNYKGTIHVEGTGSNQVIVDVDKKFDGSDADRKWWTTNTRVDFENEPGRIRVSVRYPETSCNFSCGEDEHSNYTGEVDLTIKVPQRVNLELKGHKPDMKVAGTAGDITIRSYKSPIEIASTTGAISIDTYKDAINLRDVSLHGSLSLKTGKAEAVIEAKILGDSVNIETEKGSVVLRVPRNAGLNVDYEGGRRSSFHSDLPITSDAGYRSGEIRGSVNGGGTRVRIRAERGSVVIEPLR